MDRRTFLASVTGGLLAAPPAAEAQQARKVVRIGVLEQGGSGPSPGSNKILGAFRQHLREMGYIEDQNLVMEYRFAEGRAERLPDLAAELVQLKVDVIVAGGTLGPLAAKRATTRVPIVLAAAGDPVGTGLVASLARPGGNVTGLSNHSADLTGKRLQLTKELVPGLSRIALLWNAANPIAVLVARETETAARTLGVEVQSIEVRAPDDFENALAAPIGGGVGALFVVDDPLVFRYLRLIADFAIRNRLPATAFYKQFVEAGGVMSFGASLADLYRRAAIYVDKILKGAKPEDLPVEQPTKFELVINLQTAKALGLTIPPSLLQRADQVIE
jgi:putative ABC transport system substrate-binding protein